MKMKNRINLQMMGIAASGIFCTVLLLAVVFVNLFRGQVLHDLEMDARLLRYTWGEEETSGLMTDESLKELRITLVNPRGEVIRDNTAVAEQMENHLDREEIRQAIETGEGSSVRQSRTMEKNTYYFAIRLDNGNILRVSKDAGNIWTFLIHAIPPMLLLIPLILLLCLITSRVMTMRLIAPVVALAKDMDNPQNVPIYKEMEPFVATIRKQHEELIKASDVRREFTANVSHELKTPLTIISGYAELMENGMASPEMIPHFSKEIRSGASRLLNLINDILRLSQLDAPMPEISYESVNLFRLARDVVDSMQIHAQQQSIQLTISGSDCDLCANRTMMEELITNLCSNAIRYNYSGGAVHVSVSTSKDYVILSVQDTGIGMTKAQQERIFERFYRVDKGRSRQSGGTGLGLAIVKHIAVQHNAKIVVNSELGKGTDMRVLLPKGIPESVPMMKKESENIVETYE